MDRLNLQKEVDQLRSEINRIADSANFNGIKLLDGKAGVNTTAFTSFKGVDGAEATDGTVDISKLLSAKDAGDTITHLEGAAADQKNPEAILDLGDLSITAGATSDTGTLKLNIFGQDISVELTNKTSYAKTDIAAAIKTALSKLANTDTANGLVGVNASNGSNNTTSADAVRVGDNVYSFETHADGIKFTLAGVFNGTNFKAASTSPDSTSNDFTKEQAEQMNKDLGQAVAVTGLTGTGFAKSGDVVHKTTQVQQAVAHKDATKAGIDLTLNSDIVKQGNVLTIDGQKFLFEMEDSTKTTDSNADFVINLADMKGKTEDEILHAAADKLSQTAQFNGDDDDTTRAWKIGTGSTDGKTIHIEQVIKSATGKKLDTYEKLTGKISVKGTPSAAKGKGVEITVDPSKIAAGNKLNIDGKVYTFVKGARKAPRCLRYALRLPPTVLPLTPRPLLSLAKA